MTAKTTTTKMTIANTTMRKTTTTKMTMKQTPLLFGSGGGWRGGGGV